MTHTQNYISVLVISAACCLFSCSAFARDQIHIVGSATVYPFVTASAEEFGEDGKFSTPIVEATGTGGGFKLFCESNDESTPDISDASRPITESEKQQCAKNGVEFIRLTLGYDGIVIASNKNIPRVNLTKKDLYMALAREMPDKNGLLHKNTYQNWNEVDSALPAEPIQLYGPPPTSGTRDAFIEMIMEKGCVQMNGFAKTPQDETSRKKTCDLLREDGKFIESGENYNMVVQKLSLNDKAFGIIGYGYYEENTSRVQANEIDGVLPTSDTIQSEKYGVSRKLYVYVKKAHIRKIPGIPQFLHELVSENAIGPDGYMTDRGLLPLKDSERAAMRADVKALAP